MNIKKGYIKNTLVFKGVVKIKIFDAHLHYSKIKKFYDTANTMSNVDYSEKGLKDEFLNANVAKGIAMGLTETEENRFPDSKSQNPMEIDLGKVPDNLKYCIGINPNKLDGEDYIISMDRIESKLKNPNVVGIKLYPGYYDYKITNHIYMPIIRLAEEYKLPIVIHTGEPFSNRGHPEFSHPLAINTLATKFKNVNFIICHFGYPWVIDTAVVISNNTNVYADLSGIFIGNKEKIKSLSKDQLYIDNIRRGLIYKDFYNRIMFGSDWPLVPIAQYIEFIKKLIPEKHYEDVFWNNAHRIYNIN